jgi:hypothetical protein
LFLGLLDADGRRRNRKGWHEKHKAPSASFVECGWWHRRSANDRQSPIRKERNEDGSNCWFKQRSRSIRLIS